MPRALHQPKELVSSWSWCR